jgi:hypothetical protein
MWRISVRWRFLCTLRRHLGREWPAGNTAGAQQLLLDVVLGLARLAIIELARRTKYKHTALLPVLSCVTDCRIRSDVR